MVKYVWAHDCDITADEGRICQAVTNLVSNAIKYSPREATVYISVTRVNDKTMFSIENQSEPLSEEALSNIWDSFYQADASRAKEGAGLGLSLVKRIVDILGGFVTAHSVKGEGSTFTVRIPCSFNNKKAGGV